MGNKKTAIMYKKKKISVKLREETWLHNFGPVFSVKCPIKWCTREINVFNFEAGHNIPESKGGPTTLDNLIPICSACNRGMGDTYTIDGYSVLYSLHSSKTKAKTAIATETATETATEKKAKTVNDFFNCFTFFKKTSKPVQNIQKKKLATNHSTIRSIYK
jgi:hypothetical protein